MAATTHLYRRWIAGLGLVCLLALAGGIYYSFFSDSPTESALVLDHHPAQELAATAPTTQPPDVPQPPRTYMDVVLATYPGFPTTQPLGVPLDLAHAARLVLPNPVYVCSRRDLWISQPGAPPASRMLVKAAADQTHCLDEHVRYIHWVPDDAGRWHPQVVARREDGGFDLITPVHRIDLGALAYDWPRAFSWNRSIVVPTATGAAVIEPEEDPPVRPVELLDGPAATPVQIILDTRGVIAWAPWDNGRPGSTGAIRYLDGAWMALGPEQGWPQRILQLIPLLDGSILQLTVNDPGEAQVQLFLLDHEPLDDENVGQLIDDLSHPDPQKRDSAYRELTRYGPGLWPILEEALPFQPVEAQLRMKELLRDKLRPRLGAMTLVPGPVQTISRLRDGGAVFYAERGVTVRRPADQTENIIPAWLSIRPGRAVGLLPQNLSQELTPGFSRLQAYGDEWIVLDDVSGPQRFLGNHLQPLLSDEEREFDELVGIDRRGRWAFRKPADTSQTLIIDPTLPDARPRLPVWVYPVREGQVGWTEDDWPAVDRGGSWVLMERGWRPLDEKSGEKLLTQLPVPASEPSDQPILVDADGNRYFDGLSTLRVIDTNGNETAWPLPPIANGQGPAWLIKAGDERLFLFNEPGRMLRIKPTPDHAEPFALEATFTRAIPNSIPRRIWLDPAGRIIIAEEEILYILFPTGLIPPDLHKLMHRYEEGLPD